MAAQRGESRANQNRKIRQEALREQLSNKGLVQHVLEISDKLSNLDEELDSLKVTRLKAAADLQMGLIKKYLPDLKSTELTGADGGPVKTDNTFTVRVVGD